jgi:SAM-dependent methyltransferase
LSYEEAKISDRFAQDLACGIGGVDRRSFEIIIDSRRKNFLKHGLSQKGGIFLDYGCGDGLLSRFIEEEFGQEVVGVDLSKGMVRHAFSLSGDHQRIQFLVADCHALPFKKESFNVIIGMGIFHHLDWRIGISECKRLLKVGGVLVSFEPNVLGIVASIGRRFYQTKRHTPSERPINPWEFLNELNSIGFKTSSIHFLSFVGFILPFLLTSNYSRVVQVLNRYADLLGRIDQFFERIPILKFLSWQFIIFSVKK